MLTVIGDTHGDSDHRLDGETERAVRAAEQVCHTGDFTTEAVYEAIADAAGADAGGAPLTAVHGNSDTAALRSWLPEVATVEYEGVRLVVTHGHRQDPTSLSLLAREADADIVLVGHSHTPGIEQTPDALVVNPGSYADPRGSRPAHAEIQSNGQGQGLRVTLRTPAGALLAEEVIEV